MGVNILQRSAPASSGSVVDTGIAFVASPIGTANSGVPVLCQSINDFQAAFTTRTGLAVPVWDWLDTFYREGGNQAYVLDYETAGQYVNGLAEFTPNLGPGQVQVVGETPSSAVYGAIQAHADANGRIGLLDVASTDNTAALLQAKGTLAQALTSLQNIGLFGSWLQVPAPAGVIGGTTRSVPGSAAIAALCNRVDQDGNPNQPAGGRDYPLQYATGFTFDPVAVTDQTATKAKGVNFFHDAWGVLENYAFVTPQYAGTPLTSTPFWQLNCSRTRMWIQAQAAIVGESYYMQDVDGQGKLAAQLATDLETLVLKPLYEAGALYGATPGDAYSVNVGASVNNTGTAAQGQLDAVCEARFSEYADTVNITMVSVPVAGQIS